MLKPYWGITLGTREQLLVALITVALSSCQHVGEPQSDYDYAAWSDVIGGGRWTQIAESAVKSTTLPHQIPSDIQKFCPSYGDLNMDNRVMFWVGLISAMAKFESDFDTQTRFTENLRDNSNNKVVSRGLLQISIESARQERYACKIATAEELHDPVTNISCAARILSTWVEKDGVIAYAKRKNSGGARYWSVLRASRNSLPRIGAITQSLSFCANG